MARTVALLIVVCVGCGPSPVEPLRGRYVAHIAMVGAEIGGSSPTPRPTPRPTPDRVPTPANCPDRCDNGVLGDGRIVFDCGACDRDGDGDPDDPAPRAEPEPEPELQIDLPDLQTEWLPWSADLLRRAEREGVLVALLVSPADGSCAPCVELKRDFPWPAAPADVLFAEYLANKADEERLSIDGYPTGWLMRINRDGDKLIPETIARSTVRDAAEFLALIEANR